MNINSHISPLTHNHRLAISDYDNYVAIFNLTAKAPTDFVIQTISSKTAVMSLLFVEYMEASTLNQFLLLAARNGTLSQLNLKTLEMSNLLAASPNRALLSIQWIDSNARALNVDALGSTSAESSTGSDTTTTSPKVERSSSANASSGSASSGSASSMTTTPPSYYLLVAYQTEIVLYTLGSTAKATEKLTDIKLKVPIQAAFIIQIKGMYIHMIICLLK